MALHYVFQLPEDKIIWDVGHQSYTHKILTGRKEGFDHLRMLGGMSGFPKRSESPVTLLTQATALLPSLRNGICMCQRTE